MQLNCSRLRLECFSCIMPLELLLIDLRTEWHTCYSFLGSVSVSMATVIRKIGNAIKSINHICGCKIPYNVHRRVAPYHRLEARFSATIEALVSDHLGNSKAVAYAPINVNPVGGSAGKERGFDAWDYPRCRAFDRAKRPQDRDI